MEILKFDMQKHAGLSNRPMPRTAVRATDAVPTINKQ